MKYRGIVRLNYLILFQVPRYPCGRDSVQLHSIIILLNEVPISISPSAEWLLRLNCLFTLVVRLDEQKCIKKWCRGKWTYASPSTSAKWCHQIFEMKLIWVSGEGAAVNPQFGGQPGEERITVFCKQRADEQARFSGSVLAVLRFSNLIVVQINSWSIKGKNTHSLKLKHH